MVKALAKRLDAVEETTARHQRTLDRHTRRFGAQDSVIAEIRAEFKRQHEETNTRLDTIVANGNEQLRLMQQMINTHDDELALNRETPSPSSDTVIANPPPVSTGTIHGA